MHSLEVIIGANRELEDCGFTGAFHSRSTDEGCINPYVAKDRPGSGGYKRAKTFWKRVVLLRRHFSPLDAYHTIFIRRIKEDKAVAQ
jgi:hypothetical protein